MPPSAELQRLYWRKNLRISALLLGLWFAITVGVVLLAGQLRFTVFGWPVHFWMAAQGALIAYVVLVWVYALYMDRLDAEQPHPGAD